MFCRVCNREINDVLNKPGHGHKLKTSKTLRRKIIEDVRHYPVISLKMIVAELALSELNVSKKAVVRALHPSGHWGHRPRIMPLLTQQHIKARLKFAPGYLKHGDRC